MHGMISRRGLVLGTLVIAVALIGLSCGSEEAARRDAAAEEHEEAAVQQWTCPMHPEVVSDEPGLCPTCNMNLVPKAPEQATEGEDAPIQQWTCPMHPEVVSDEPGLCPTCNMKLVPRASTESGESDAGHSRAHDAAHSHELAGDTETGSHQEWTCGMHPAIRSEEPGKCPICNMDLVPVKEDATGALRVDPGALQLVGARHELVSYLPLVKLIWAVGKVEYDERRVKHVASRIPGRIEKLHADFVGTGVIRGEPLLSIYSPELVTALAEYKTALAAAAFGSEARGVASRGAGSLAQSAKVRLTLWGLDDNEVERALDADVTAAYRLPIRSPISGTVIEKHVSEGEYVKEGEDLFVVADLSKVWLTAEVYEEDIGYIRVGDMVMSHARAYPDEMFHGEVAFVDPYVDERARSVRIRIDIDNPTGKLKPGMYLEAYLEVPLSRETMSYWTCPMHPDVVRTGPGECPQCGMFLERIAPGHVLAVPKEAVVRAGDAPVVYVERSPGTYELRQVTLGDLSGLRGDGAARYYPVIDGLMAGEQVITEASFLIHSQARLTGTAASAYGGALKVDAPVHRH